MPSNLSLVSVEKDRESYLTALKPSRIEWGNKIYAADLSAVEDEGVSEELFSNDYMDDLQKKLKAIEEATANESESGEEETELKKVNIFFNISAT